MPTFTNSDISAYFISSEHRVGCPNLGHTALSYIYSYLAIELYVSKNPVEDLKIRVIL